MMAQIDGDRRDAQKPQYNYKFPRIMLAFWGAIVLLALTTVGMMVGGHVLDEEGHHTLATFMFVGGCLSFGGACVLISIWMSEGD